MTDTVTLPEIITVPGVRPFVQIGLGDTRITVGQARWDDAHWDEDEVATWGGTDVVWANVDCQVQDIVATLGRVRVTDRFEPATATLIVDNSSGWADLDPDDIANLTLRPGRALRFGVVHETYGSRVLFRGYVDEVLPDYDPELEDTVTIECIDALGEAGRVMLPRNDVASGTDERGSQRIDRLLDAANWPPEKRQIASTSVTMIGTTFGKQTIDMLTATADSEGGAVFGDLNGRVAYRGKDWQSYPSDQPNDGTIGNLGTTPALPGIPAFLRGYLGSATTPDTPDMALPNEFTIPFKVRGPVGGIPLQTIGGQWEGFDCSWLLRRAEANGDLWFHTSPTGDPADVVATGVAGPAVTGDDEFGALSVTLDDGAGNSVLTSWTNPDGDPDNWTVYWTTTFPALTVHNASSVLRIAAQQSFYERFSGYIYWVEMRRGLHPTARFRMWLFDPTNYPGYGNTWGSDGRPWTTTSILAIELAVRPTPAEVCPSRWEISHRRKDIVTQVVLGRDDGNATPQRIYNDSIGQAIYGVETPYSLTDLVATDNDQLDRLADRLFRTRGKYNAPRVEAVTIDASTSTAARDLLTLLSVFEPSRYRCRLERDRGTIFDTTNFATGVRHHITPDGWEARITLDLAAAWIADGARWDQTDWNNATWGTPA